MIQDSKTSEIRFYRFFNITKGEYGEPFALCDRHAKEYKTPDNCIRYKIADKACQPCWKCENE